MHCIHPLGVEFLYPEYSCDANERRMRHETTTDPGGCLILPWLNLPFGCGRRRNTHLFDQNLHRTETVGLGRFHPLCKLAQQLDLPRRVMLPMRDDRRSGMVTNHIEQTAPV